ESIEKGYVETRAMEVQHDRSRHVERQLHGGMDSFDAAGLTGTAGHDVDGAFVRPWTGRVFAIRTVAVFTSVAPVLHVGVTEIRGAAVMTVHQPRTLIGVAVPAEDEIAAAGFQERIEDFAHFPTARVAVFVVVRIVGCLRVGWMMPVRDEPGLL